MSLSVSGTAEQEQMAKIENVTAHNGGEGSPLGISASKMMPISQLLHAIDLAQCLFFSLCLSTMTMLVSCFVSSRCHKALTCRTTVYDNILFSLYL